MTAAEILVEAGRRGVTLEARGDRLSYRGAKSAITPDFLALIRQHKKAILALLRPTTGITSLEVPSCPTNDLLEGKGEKTSLEPAHMEAQALLAAIVQWVGDEPNRWDKLLKALKQTWTPTVPTVWIPDSPRDILVAWTAANHRLVEAQLALGRFQQVTSLTSRQRVTREARKADVSFFGSLAESLWPRAIMALMEDGEGSAILANLCRGHSVGGQS